LLVTNNDLDEDGNDYGNEKAKERMCHDNENGHGNNKKENDNDRENNNNNNQKIKKYTYINRIKQDIINLSKTFQTSEYKDITIAYRKKIQICDFTMKICKNL